MSTKNGDRRQHPRAPRPGRLPLVPLKLPPEPKPQDGARSFADLPSATVKADADTTALDTRLDESTRSRTASVGVDRNGLEIGRPGYRAPLAPHPLDAYWGGRYQG